MVAGKIHHWKHGWIPITSEAKAFVAGRGPDPTALDVRSFDDLPPGLQGKIAAKLKSLTGLDEPELAKRVQNNLDRLYERADKSQSDWYAREGEDLGKRAQRIADEFPRSRMTQEKMTGMVAVTSAHKRWLENKDFAESIARKLAVDEPFDVTPQMISDYNAWAGKRKTGLAAPHLDLKPGTYRPSELPTDFAVSKTPGMPRHINTDYVIRAAQIYKGEVALDTVVAGPKQRSFVNNLMNPDDPRFVTVDTWHYEATMGDIPIRFPVAGKPITHTLPDWSNRDVTVADGRAMAYGYDPSKDRYDPKNLAATIKATREPQGFFQSGPASKADGWRSSWGTYPWFVKQTQIAADRHGVSPSKFQAVVWYAEGGGA